MFGSGERKVFEGRHCLVTGGSSGIGLATAKHLLSLGAKVTILARNQAKLDKATEELRAGCGDAVGAPRVQGLSADVTRFEAVEGAVKAACEAEGMGDVSVLVCSAGDAECMTFEDTPLDQFEKLMRVNYIGTVNCVRAALPYLKEEAKRREQAKKPTGGSCYANIVLVSSQAGQVGLYGYTAYSPPKFALTGFAQALRMEVKDIHKVAVSVCYPPDTDTPQLQHENETKPAITKALVGTTVPFTPESVAACIVRGMRRERFTVAVGFDGWALATATAGFSPPSSVAAFLTEVILMGIMRIVVMAYLVIYYTTVRSMSKKMSKKND